MGDPYKREQSKIKTKIRKLNRVFHPFYTTDKGVDYNKEGTGG